MFFLFTNQPSNRHLRPLIGQDLSFPPPPPPPPSLYKTLFLSFLFISHPCFQFLKSPSLYFFSFSGSSIVKNHGGRAFRPRVRCSSPSPTGGSNPVAPTAATPPAVAPSAVAPPATAAPRPSRRAPPSKRARTSGLGESSSSRPQEPQ